MFSNLLWSKKLISSRKQLFQKQPKIDLFQVIFCDHFYLCPVFDKFRPTRCPIRLRTTFKVFLDKFHARSYMTCLYLLSPIVREINGQIYLKNSLVGIPPSFCSLGAMAIDTPKFMRVLCKNNFQQFLVILYKFCRFFKHLFKQIFHQFLNIFHQFSIVFINFHQN